jgi:large subunit ribosomal protein L11
VKKKKIKSNVSIQVVVGKANPAALGSSLGPHGINIGAFCKDFDQKVSGAEPGTPIPVEMVIYEDRSFDFITKQPPVSYFLKKCASIASGSQTPGKSIAGTVTKKQIEEIYNTKAAELNAYDKEAGMKIIAGSARSMGIVVAD